MQEIYSYVYTSELDSRNIRKVINALLKSSTALEVKKIPYCSSYTIKDKNITKVQQQILVVSCLGGLESKLQSFLKPQDFTLLFKKSHEA